MPKDREVFVRGGDKDCQRSRDHGAGNSRMYFTPASAALSGSREATGGAITYWATFERARIRSSRASISSGDTLGSVTIGITGAIGGFGSAWAPAWIRSTS